MVSSHANDIQTFPYSRHSSYNELCHLIEAFKPKNIHPCTVDDANWSPASSMSFLFGHIYSSPPSFSHDQMMLRMCTTTSNTQGSGLRPDSAGNSGSGYATPNGGHSAPALKREEQKTMESSRPDTANNQRGDRLSVDDKLPGTKRKRRGGKAQGDFWPPEGLDQYSSATPDERNGRPSSTDLALNTSKDKISYDRPNLTTANATSKTRSSNRWHERIAEAMPLEWRNDVWPTKREDKGRYTERCGRLSSPPEVNGENDDSEEEIYLDKSRHRHSTYEVLESSQQRSSSLFGGSPSVDGRMALRCEAFNAALSSNGAQWSDIGMVSVDGHQTKEEQL